VLRLAIAALVICAATLPTRAEEAGADKISNDRPDRPLHMPAASSETKEAFDDFDRFARRSAWERATKALYSIPDDQAGRFIDGKDGFIVPVARKRRDVLSNLSPEGQAAYRLFYDSDAEKLFAEANGPKEQETLERLYSSYFLTSVGDDAADRLGDLYFEKGQYDRAADCWLSILRERPDSELSPVSLTVKAALALARAGRRSELDALRPDLTGRFAAETVNLGGRKRSVADLAKELKVVENQADDTISGTGEGPTPALFETVTAAWQVRFGESVTAGMSPEELVQWEASPLSRIVPQSAVHGRRLYINYLGHLFAVDLITGKMLWRSASFHNLETMANQNQAMGAAHYAILADDAHVWTLGRDPKDQNYNATSLLICRRAETGEIVWQSQALSEYTGIQMSGRPILEHGTMFLACKKSPTESSSNSNFSYYGSSGNQHQYVMAVRPGDGKILWSADVGVIRDGNRYYYYGQADSSPDPSLIYRAGSIYIDTHNGILARIDADSGAVDWGYGYPTDPVQSNSGSFFFINGMLTQSVSTSSGSRPLRSGDALLIKGAKSDRLCAIDPDRMALLWQRPIAKSARLLGVDDEVIYLGGPELGALDLKTRVLRWSTPLPGGSDDGQVIVRADGIWQLTPRGIFEVDPKTGAVRRIFRGDDDGSGSGDLILTDNLLLAITNRAISAYPRGPAPVAHKQPAANSSPTTKEIE
jgi:outer membrane protein assembly factor BamB